MTMEVKLESCTSTDLKEKKHLKDTWSNGSCARTVGDLSVEFQRVT